LDRERDGLDRERDPAAADEPGGHAHQDVFRLRSSRGDGVDLADEVGCGGRVAALTSSEVLDAVAETVNALRRLIGRGADLHERGLHRDAGLVGRRGDRLERALGLVGRDLDHQLQGVTRHLRPRT
jgi:hypothetical protein